MADVGGSEISKQENTNSRFTPTSDLLAPDKNPLLREREKFFIKALVRGTGFSPSAEPENVSAKGISEKTLNILREMVTAHDGTRRPYSLVVQEFNSKNLSDSPIQLTNPRTAGVLATVASGITGDFEGVIGRVAEGNGNCLEFSLTMQLVAKAFYPDTIHEAEILAYNENTNLIGKISSESRHFYLFTKSAAPKDGDAFTLYPYAGRPRKVTKNEALWSIEHANKKGEFGLKNIYRGFIALIDKGN